MLLSDIRKFSLQRHQKPLILIGLTVVAYVTAINRPQMLPWVIAALLSATLITGFVWPHWLIKRLSVTRTGPMRAEEGQLVTFQVEIKNHGWMPRFMVEAVDHIPFVGAANNDVALESMLGLVAYIGCGASRHFAVSLLCEKRGFYKLGPVGLASSFPLGLTKPHQYKNGGVQTITIYPDIFQIVRLPLFGAPTEIHRGGFLLREGAGSAEFSGLREYRSGDNPRHIHWPSTARANEIMVKEFEPLASASLYVIMDLSKGANIGQGKHCTFEYAVRITASIGRYACNNGMPISVAADGVERYSIGLGLGEAHFQEILDVLAVVDANGYLPYAKGIQQAAMNIRYGQTAVIFLSESEVLVSETIQAIALLQARGVNILAIAFDCDTFRGMPAQSRSPWIALFDLGINYMTIRKGDDLVRLFNP